MMEKACEIKREQVTDEPSKAGFDQLRDMLILLAHQQQVCRQRYAACDTLEQALLLQM